jgi:Fe-S-cluster containining protein
VRALRILQEQREAIRLRVQDEVARAVGEDPAGAACRAHEAMDEEWRRSLARQNALQPACSAGCSHCCHVHADATIPEVMAVARHLRRTLGPEAQRALVGRLSQQAEIVEHLGDEERWAAKIPCALLDRSGRCSIYEARPLRCRAFHSCSVDECRDAFAGREGAIVVTVPLLERAVDAVEEGYDSALQEAGFSAEGYRLEIALLVLLEDPGAVDRWLGGEPVFARARAGAGG